MTRSNNFDAIRLALATLVLYSHSYALTGETDPIARLTHSQMEGGGLAVAGFFVVSGYLITQSWIATKSTDRFLVKRIRRIYPGFLVAVVVSFMVAAVCSPTVRFIKYVVFNSEDAVRTVLLLSYGMLDNPAAFPNNPFPRAVNGSLWTLQPELFCYLIVAGLGALGLLHRRRVILGGVLLLYALFVLLAATRIGVSPTGFARLLLYFSMGAIWFLYETPLGVSWVVVALSVAFVAGMFLPPTLTIVGPLAGSYLLLSLAFSKRLRLHGVAARGDLSYGVYLYAFVVQQAFVSVGHLAHRPLTLFALALPVTFGCAWCSWHFVERRFLVRSPVIPPSPLPPRELSEISDGRHRSPASIGAN